MRTNINDYTSGYLAPVKIHVQNENRIFVDAFLYNVNEKDEMEEIIETVILSNKIFNNRSQVGRILRENAKAQVMNQINKFVTVVNHNSVSAEIHNIPINLEFKIENFIFKDSFDVCSFVDYEPEIYSNDVCHEHGIPLDTSKYISFAIRDQIFGFLLNIYNSAQTDPKNKIVIY